MDTELLQALAPLGVGGSLAGVMFFFYRQDFLRERVTGQADRDRAEHREDRLLQIIERNAAAYERLAVTMEHIGSHIAPPEHGAVPIDAAARSRNLSPR